jgi:hypothetical protein
MSPGTAAACRDRKCHREANHAGLHMSRVWDSRNCTEIIDEWGDMQDAQEPRCKHCGKQCDGPNDDVCGVRADWGYCL